MYCRRPGMYERQPIKTPIYFTCLSARLCSASLARYAAVRYASEDLAGSIIDCLILSAMTLSGISLGYFQTSPCP